MQVYTTNIVIHSGCNFAGYYTLKRNNAPISLSSSTISANLKQNANSIYSIPLNTTIINASDGIFKVYLTYTETNNIKDGRYMYDVILTDADNVKTKLIEGFAIVKSAISV